MNNTAFLNSIYQPLEEKQNKIIRILKNIDNVKYGWYNGHYNKNNENKWIRNSFPIPEVNIMGLCDIEISFEKITVTTKLKRNVALEYDYNKLTNYEFEAYGVENYLSDFYSKNMSIQDLKGSIEHSSENEIGFSFSFPMDICEAIIYEFIDFLSNEEFYY